MWILGWFRLGRLGLRWWVIDGWASLFGGVIVRIVGVWVRRALFWRIFLWLKVGVCVIGATWLMVARLLGRRFFVNVIRQNIISSACYCWFEKMRSNLPEEYWMFGIFQYILNDFVNSFRTIVRNQMFLEAIFLQIIVLNHKRAFISAHPLRVNLFRIDARHKPKLFSILLFQTVSISIIKMIMLHLSRMKVIIENKN